MTRRLAAKVDINQAEIVAALRRCGATVQSLASIGHGCPDLLVGYREINYLMEIKDGNKAASRRQLTDDELCWLSDWRGQAFVVESIDDALAIIGAI